MGSHRMSPPMEPSSPHDGGIRKRVCKACDRCRLKKSKCDGSSPCSRCKTDNAICVFGERKKSHDKVYPKGYVEMLESQQAQLVSGLQELYRRLQDGEGWTGSPLKENGNGVPLTHDILESLGALKQEGHHTNESFEEDLNVLQRKLIANGAGFMQREPSFDTNSESDHSTIYESTTQSSSLRGSMPLNQFPPTPPSQSPFQQPAHTVAKLKTQTYPGATMNHSNLNWSTPISDIDGDMEFMNQFDSPLMDPTMDFSTFSNQIFQDQLTSTAINPVLTMKDWANQEDFQMYFNPTMA